MLDNTDNQNITHYVIHQNFPTLNNYFYIEKSSNISTTSSEHIDNNTANEILSRVNLALENISYISLQNYHELTQCFFDLSKVTNSTNVIDKQSYFKALLYQKQLLDKMILFVREFLIEMN